MLVKKLLIATIGTAITLTTFSDHSAIAAYASPARIAPNFNQIYVFGDSLSDIGNVYEITERNSPISPPYFKGRYSNGPVWVEYLAYKLKLPLNTSNNYAYGGATTGNTATIPPGLLRQIHTFKNVHSQINPQALYIIWAGSNDYLGGGTDYTIPINNLENAIKSLSAGGAQNILVVNLPDLGKLPGTRNTERAATLNSLTKKHNSALAVAVNSLNKQFNSQGNIKYINVNSLFNQVITNPDKFGFKNVTQACLGQGRVCNNPNQYLFWDGIHPTTAAHKLFVELAFSQLQTQPQPTASVPTSKPEITVPLGIFIVSALGTGVIVARKKAMNQNKKNNRNSNNSHLGERK